MDAAVAVMVAAGRGIPAVGAVEVGIGFHAAEWVALARVGLGITAALESVFFMPLEGFAEKSLFREAGARRLEIMTHLAGLRIVALPQTRQVIQQRVSRFRVELRFEIPRPRRDGRHFILHAADDRAAEKIAGLALVFAIDRIQQRVTGTAAEIIEAAFYGIDEPHR